MGTLKAMRFFLGILVASLSGLVTAPAAAAGKRVALVIGNSAYVHAPALPNPRNDATALAQSLEQLGFTVIKGVDLDRRRFEETVRDFARQLRTAEAGFFFYAGHGLQVNGINYLVPVNAKLVDEADLDFETIQLDTILKQMERETPITLVFLDACRDNPLARSLARGMGTRSVGIGRGLAKIDAGTGTFIAFATQPGNVALDGDGDHSPFTKALLKNIHAPQLDVALLVRQVRREVRDETGGRQVPWNNSSLTSDFYFNPQSSAGQATGGGGTTSPAPSPDISQGLEAIRKQLEDMRKPDQVRTPAESDQAAQAWESIKNTDSTAVLKAFADRFPTSLYADFARARLQELQGAPPPASPAALPPSPPPQITVYPSFPCSKAALPSEIAICNSSVLAQLDLQMNDLYSNTRASLNSAQRRQLTNIQRAWLDRRNACAYDAGCIQQRYQEQINYLGSVN